MSGSLFREEALANCTSPLVGGIQHEARHGFLLIAVGLVLLTTLSAWFIGHSNYSRKHFVTGQIDESTANAIVATDWGHVDRLLVSEGQPVEAGAHLLTAVRTVDGRSAAIAEEVRQQLDKWRTAILVLKEDYTNQDQAFRITERQLEIRESLARQGIKLQEIRVAQQEEHLQNTRALHQAGYLSDLDWLGFRTSLLSEQQKLNTLRGQFIDLQRNRTDIRQRRSSARSAFESEATALEARLSSLRERLIEFEQAPFRELVANRTGVVTRIETREGASIQPGQPLIYIDSPEHALTGTLNIPPMAAGHLVSGQVLTLELDAFPAQTYGRVEARVTQLSPHAISSNDQPGYFLARLNIQSNSRINAILPGMTFRTNIPVERRTLFSWLLKPLEKLGETLG